MTSYIEAYWWVVVGLLLGIAVLGLSLAVRNEGNSSLPRKVWRAVLGWPLLLDSDKKRGQVYGRRALVLVAILVAIAAVAIWITPPAR